MLFSFEVKRVKVTTGRLNGGGDTILLFELGVNKFRMSELVYGMTDMRTIGVRLEPKS